MEVYSKLVSEPGKMRRYLYVRGTSQLEGYHTHLGAVLNDGNYSDLLASTVIDTSSFR